MGNAVQRDLSSMPVCCLRQESLEEAIEETWLLCQEEKFKKYIIRKSAFQTVQWPPSPWMGKCLIKLGFFAPALISTHALIHQMVQCETSDLHTRISHLCSKCLNGMWLCTHASDKALLKQSLVWTARLKICVEEAKYSPLFCDQKAERQSANITHYHLLFQIMLRGK